MKNVGPWTGRNVVVCGGTSGLGLQLVVAAAQQKANVVIIGRDLARLGNAEAFAMQQGANSAAGYSVNLNVTDLSQTSSTGRAKLDDAKLDDRAKLQQWLSKNNVDLLVNSIGRSDRGDLEQVSDTDLASLLNDNLLCTWNMTRMTLDSLKRARGTIVNIGSLAGLVAAPGMGGYSVSKSALTAMSRQLRLELASVGVHVLLVCPGPIAREDSGTRYHMLAEKRGLKDQSSTAPGGGVKLRLIDPKVLCQKILEAAHQGKKELVYPVKAAWLAAIADLSPSIADWILRKYIGTKERK